MEKQPAHAGEPRLHIPITLGAELLLEIIDLKLRIKSLLVGMEHEQYLVIKIYPNDLIGTFRSEAVKESPIIIRYFYKGAVYGFRATILNIVSAPAKLFFVTYPEKFEEIKALDTARFECILPASTMLGNEIVDMTVVDISKEGCLCMIKMSPEKNDKLYGLLRINQKIDLMVQFPGMVGKSDLIGLVRNMSKGTERIMLGIIFEEMLPDARAKLDHLISLTQGSRKQ